jgi:hypothetical protein
MQQAIGQGRLAVVDMGNNAKVSNMVRGHRRGLV